MKRKYINPTVELQEFSVEKVLMTSGINGINAAGFALNSAGVEAGNVNTMSLNSAFEAK